MGLLTLAKTKITDLLKRNVLAEPVYMEKNAAFVCQDKQDKATKTTRIIAEHINEDMDIPITFPQFSVTKTTSLQGMIGMHFKHVLTLDADDYPTEGSKNLLTSGAIFEVITELQNQIDELKEQLKN